MAMNRKEFVKLLSNRFYPKLRKEGFVGSGTTLRRINEPLVHVFNVQANNMNDGVWINVCAHLTFLFPPVPAAKLNEYQCAFRYRLHPPTKDRENAWPFGENEDEANAIIDDLETAWDTAGREVLDRFATYPASFEKLLREVDSTTLKRNEAVAYKTIAEHIAGKS